MDGRLLLGTLVMQYIQLFTQLPVLEMHSHTQLFNGHYLLTLIIRCSSKCVQKNLWQLLQWHFLTDQTSS